MARLRFFVLCPWGTEPYAAAECRMAAVPHSLSFGPTVPRKHITVSGEAFVAEPTYPSPPVSQVASFSGIVPMPGVLHFVVDLSGITDGDRTPALRSLINKLAKLRSIEGLYNYIYLESLGVKDAASVTAIANRPDFVAAVKSAAAVCSEAGLFEPYRTPMNIDAELLTATRMFGGAETRAGRGVKESSQAVDAEAEKAAEALFVDIASNPVSTSEPTERVLFRVDTERKNKAADITSPAISEALGYAIGVAVPEWVVSMRFCNLEIFALHDTETLLIGARCHARNVPRGAESLPEMFAMELQRRAIGQAIASGRLSLSGVRYATAAPSHFKHDLRGGKGGNSMNPAIARFLVALAALQPGEVTLDPLAGVGTIPMEAALHCPLGVHLGGELDGDEVKLERFNGDPGNFRLALSAYGLIGRATGSEERDPRTKVQALSDNRASSGLCIGTRWDARKLPLRSGVIDVIFSDLPFGKRCGNAKQNLALYPRIVDEFERVLRPNGRVVLLTTEAEVLSALLTSRTGWAINFAPFAIDMNGLNPFVFSARWTPATAGA
jgi:hypothetical protein